MKNFVFVLIFLCVVALIPDVVFAQNGLVTCTGLDCNFCYFADMVEKVLNFITTLLIIISVIFLAVTGVQIAASGGNENAKQILKERLSNIVIGFVLVLASWVIVDTLIKVLVVDNYTVNNWRTPVGELCFGQVSPEQSVPGNLSTGSGGVGGGTCAQCIPIPAEIPTNGNACGGTGACQIDKDIANSILGMGENFSGWRVSEGWPATGSTPDNPTGVHSSSCHGSGTCIDVSFSGTLPSASAIKNFTKSAQQNSLTPVYEVSSPERQKQLQAAGITNVIVVPGISREHFSVYACSKDPSPKACRQ